VEIATAWETWTSGYYSAPMIDGTVFLVWIGNGVVDIYNANMRVKHISGVQSL